MRSQRFFIVGLVLLLSLFVYGCGAGTTGAGNTSAPSSTQSANALIVNSTLSALKIEADIPPMQVKHQVIVVVSIFPTGGPIRVSDVSIEKNATAIVTNATPVGTPGKTLVDAFGANHSVDATATLETSPDVFSVAPTGPQIKPLDQNRVEWDWFVTPLIDRNQTIGVDIEVQWTSMKDGKKSLPYTLGYPKFPVNVQAAAVEFVPTPTPAPVTSAPPDPLAIFVAILTLLAAVLTFSTALITIPGFRHWMRDLFSPSKRNPPAEPRAPS
ncbi:MAG TPA: hypothetical protein VKP04_00400 [Ktedonobacteraceae bacterium]|nr:hypothetical protein [Ktedonobacteraceae bacterium]